MTTQVRTFPVADLLLNRLVPGDVAVITCSLPGDRRVLAMQCGVALDWLSRATIYVGGSDLPIGEINARRQALDADVPLAMLWPGGGVDVATLLSLGEPIGENSRRARARINQSAIDVQFSSLAYCTTQSTRQVDGMLMLQRGGPAEAPWQYAIIDSLEELDLSGYRGDCLSRVATTLHQLRAAAQVCQSVVLAFTSLDARVCCELPVDHVFALERELGSECGTLSVLRSLPGGEAPAGAQHRAPHVLEVRYDESYGRFNLRYPRREEPTDG